MEIRGPREGNAENNGRPGRPRRVAKAVSPIQNTKETKNLSVFLRLSTGTKKNGKRKGLKAETTTKRQGRILSRQRWRGIVCLEKKRRRGKKSTTISVREGRNDGWRKIEVKILLGEGKGEASRGKTQLSEKILDIA